MCQGICAMQGWQPGKLIILCISGFLKTITLVVMKNIFDKTCSFLNQSEICKKISNKIIWSFTWSSSMFKMLSSMTLLYCFAFLISFPAATKRSRSLLRDCSVRRLAFVLVPSGRCIFSLVLSHKRQQCRPIV